MKNFLVLAMIILIPSLAWGLGTTAGSGMGTSNTNSGGTCAIATSGSVGCVQPDNATITINGSGVISAAAGNIVLGSITTTNPQISGNVTSGFYTAGAGLVDVAISGIKVTEWASTGVTNVGTNTSNSFIPTSSTLPTDGLYLPAANTPSIAARSLRSVSFTNPASAVNYWSFTGSATGVAPSVTMAGTDTSGAGLGLQILGLAATATGAGGPITITAGNSFGSAVGGSISITAGTAAGTNTGGTITIAGGLGASAAGGAVTVRGGPPASGNAAGAVSITGGVANNGAGGPVTVSGSAASGNNVGGATTITAGASSGSASNGGSVAINSGIGTTTGVSGTVTITPSAGATTSGSTAGALTMAAGAGGAAASTDGNVGAIASLTGGAGGTTNNVGGVGRLRGGAGAGSRAGGEAQLTGGAGGATGLGGNATITSGAGGATSGVAGDVNLNLGTTTSSAGGTLPSINSGGFLAFTTTQTPIATKTGVHMVTAGVLGLTSTGVDELTVAAGLVSIPNIATDATHTTATVCVDTTSKGIYFGSAALGVCLGTSSSRYKHDIVDMKLTMADLKKLRPVNFYYNKGYGDPNKKQYGFIAEEVVRVMPDFVGLDKARRPNSVDMLGMIPVLVLAIQEQQKEIDILKKKVNRK